MNTPSELDRIKQHNCPRCNATAGHACRSVHRGETRIYPYNPGSSAEEWVHPDRRNVAIRMGSIPDTPKHPAKESVSAIRALIRKRGKK